MLHEHRRRVLRVSLVALLAGVGSGCSRQAPPEPLAALDAAFIPVLESYLPIQDALAADHLRGVDAHARALAELAKGLDAARLAADPGLAPEERDNARALPGALSAAAERLAGAGDLESARHHFGEVSRALAVWARNRKPAGVQMVWCPMAPGGWLQREGPVRNPYFGASMLACGTVVSGRAPAP